MEGAERVSEKTCRFQESYATLAECGSSVCPSPHVASTSAQALDLPVQGELSLLLWSMFLLKSVCFWMREIIKWG